MKIWLDGNLQEASENRISGMTHALHYRTGVFEGIRSYAGVEESYLFRLEDHVDRLFDSAKTLRMSVPFSKTEIESAVQQVLVVNNLSNAYVRPLIFVGEGSMSLDIASSRASNSIHTLVAAWEWKSYFCEATAAGLNVQIGPWKRIFQTSGLNKVKASGFYVNSYLAYADAREAGYDEAILVEENGNLAEASASNVFIVAGTTLITPRTTAALPGITRSTIIEIARDNGFGVEIRDISIEEISQADHAFLTGTACEVTPIARINGKSSGNRTGAGVTRALAVMYQKAVRNEYMPIMRSATSEWCTPLGRNARVSERRDRIAFTE